MAKYKNPNILQAVYRSALKEQIKILKNKGFKPRCVKKIDLRYSTETLEKIFKEGLLVLLNLTEVAVDPDGDFCIRDWREFYAITKDMNSFKASNLPITKSLWWVIAEMTNPYYMHTYYKQRNPKTGEYVYDPKKFKPGLPLKKYQVKRTDNFYVNKEEDITITANIDYIPVRTVKISDYKGTSQYVKKADERNMRLFAGQLSKLTGRPFDIVCNRTLENLTGTDVLSIAEESDDDFYIYAVCSAA